MQKELQTQSATLSDSDRATKAKSLDDKQKEMKRAGEDAQADYQQDMQQTFAAVAGKFAETLDAYSKEHGFSVVLDGGNQQLPVVIYANPSVDITKAVVDAYNVKSGIPAPEKTATPATAPKTTAPSSARSLRLPQCTKLRQPSEGLAPGEAFLYALDHRLPRVLSPVGIHGPYPDPLFTDPCSPV